MREVVLDTETTGFDPNAGHRLVELACIELINGVPSKRPPLHRYVNPKRDVPEDAFRVHGLSTEFLADKPPFEEIVDEFLEFIGDDARLVIHNADFDMRFLNAELKWANKPLLAADRSLCTMIMARKKFPGAPASLDALCKRFGIDNSHRTYHGALLDTELLADVYIELTGGRQTGFNLAADAAQKASQAATGPITIERPFRPARPHGPSEAEQTAHAEFLKKLKNPIWLAE
jgi:DNA polymerase-3 subunit epsilon